MKRQAVAQLSASLFLILLFIVLCNAVILQAPVGKVLRRLTISPSKAEIRLGAAALGQRPGIRSAGSPHLGMQFKGGQWHLRNLAPDKKIDVATDTTATIYLKRLPLTAGTYIHIGPSVLRAVEATPERMVLHQPGSNHTAVWEAGQLTTFPPAIIPAGRVHRIRSRLKWYLRDPAREQRLLSLGGNHNLRHQVALPNTAPGSAWIVRREGNFYLAPGKARRVGISSADGLKVMTFHDLSLPFEGPQGTVRRLVVGRTHYTVKTAGKTLSLTPGLKRDFFPLAAGPAPRSPSSTTASVYDTRLWIGAGQPLMAWVQKHLGLTAAGALVSGLLGLLVWHLKSYYAVTSHWTLSFVFVWFWLVWIAVCAKTAINLAYALATCSLIWIWTSWALFVNGRLRGTAGWLLPAAIFLAGAGILLHIQLLAGAGNTRWLIYAWKQTLMVALIGQFLGLIAYLPGRAVEHLWTAPEMRYANPFIKTGFLAICVLALAMLILLSLRGNEQGMGWFQPSEAMKSILIFLAGMTTIDIHGALTYRGRSLRQSIRAQFIFWADILFILVIMCAGTLASFSWIGDISPLFIIAVMILWWLWRTTAGHFSHTGTTVSTRPWTRFTIGARCMIITLLLLSLGFLGAIHRNPAGFAWLPQADRWAVWRNPESHPHSGAQVREAMTMVGLGKLVGAEENWFGQNQRGNHLPAVQDDFALSFFIYKYGQIAAIVLSLVQLIYLIILWQVGSRLNRLSGDAPRRRSGYFWGFGLQGLALVHGLQWGIAWGNSLGLLPVMGQPMTWLSAGNSHLLCVGFPALTLSMVGSWITDLDSHYRKSQRRITKNGSRQVSFPSNELQR